MKTVSLTWYDLAGLRTLIVRIRLQEKASEQTVLKMVFTQTLPFLPPDANQGVVLVAKTGLLRRPLAFLFASVLAPGTRVYF